MPGDIYALPTAFPGPARVEGVVVLMAIIVIDQMWVSVAGRSA